MTDAPNPPEVEALFPEGSQPEPRLRTVSSLCSTATRPHALTGFLKQLLTAHFADPDNIEDPMIRQQLLDAGAWKPSENGEHVSGILIESITKWQPNDSGKRPAIVIKRNSWSWDRRYPGDCVGEEYQEGEDLFSGFWMGSHTLFALAQAGGEAELLGTEVSRFVLHYGKIVVEQMDLHNFALVQVDTLHELREANEGYAVPVTVAYAAEENWKLQPYAPRLKRIKFRASELLD